MGSERVTGLFRTMPPYFVHEHAHDFRVVTRQRRVGAMLQGRTGHGGEQSCE